MSKRRKKFGLQKDFSSIFEGVWIPPKGRGQDSRPEPNDQELPLEEEEPAVESQEAAVEAPKSDEQTRTVQHPAIEEPSRTGEFEPYEPEESVSEQDVLGEEASSVEVPASEEDDFAEAGDTAFQPNPEIEKIISTMKCSKGFVCYKSNFQQLCKVNYVGEGKIIECSPLNQGPCAYRFSFMGKVFCKCPLRYYIARNLGM